MPLCRTGTHVQSVSWAPDQQRTTPQAVRDDPKVIAAYLGADEEEAIAVMESGS